MATPKCLIGLAIVCTVVLGMLFVGFVPGVGAETMKAKAVMTATKTDALPVGDEEGHALVLQMLQGLFLFENGEIAKGTAYAIADFNPAKGAQATGYIFLTFEDGSTIVQKIQRLMTPDKRGNFDATMSGELVKGTGRFEGINGTTSSTGKNFLSGKGEATRLLMDLTFTYTLPGK